MAKSKINFWNFILVISGISLSLKLATSGNITAELAAVFLLLIVIGAALNSNFVKAVLAIAGLLYFLLDYVDYNMSLFYQLGGSAIALLLVLFGIYTIIKGVFSK